MKKKKQKRNRTDECKHDFMIKWSCRICGVEYFNAHLPRHTTFDYPENRKEW